MTVDRSALISMPTSDQLGGAGQTPFIRFPFFPTAPWYSTNPAVGYQVRYYSTGIIGTDADFIVNQEATRTVQFDIPCRLIAINGAAVLTANMSGANSLNTQNMNLQYLFRTEYTTGDRLQTQARLAAEVVGTMENPGEIGGHGYNIDQGASLICGITPLQSAAAGGGDMRIDITFVCLEIRGPRNFSAPGRR